MFIDKSHSHSKPASSMCRDTGTYANTEYGRVEPDNLDKIIPSTFFPVRWLVLMCCCCCQHPANFWSQLTRAIFRREAKMNEVLCGKRAIGANIRTQESDYHYFVSPFSCQHRPTSANTYSKCETHALFMHAKVCCMDLGFGPNNVNIQTLLEHVNSKLPYSRLGNNDCANRKYFWTSHQWASDYHDPDFRQRYMLHRLQGAY